MLSCRDDGDGTILKVHLTPKASKEGLAGLYGDALKVKVKAPPVDGKANKALVKFLAGRLDISSSRVEIIAGQTSRSKTVRISDIASEEVVKRLSVD